MPVQKRQPRTANPSAAVKPQNVGKRAVRQSWDRFVFFIAQIGADLLASLQLRRRDYALGLIDYRNELRSVLSKTRETAIGCYCGDDVCSCWPTPRPNLELAEDLAKQIEEVDRELRRYTETHRPDWIECARNGETKEDAVVRILAENKLKPHRKAGKGKDRNLQKRINGEILGGYAKRLEHTEAVIAALGSRKKLDKLNVATDENGAPVNRWGDPLTRAQLEDEAARLRRLALPKAVTKKPSDKLKSFAISEADRERWARETSSADALRNRGQSAR